MALKTPQDLLTKELKEIHSAERQLSRALNKFGKTVTSPNMRQMLERRREQGATLIESLDEAFDEMGMTKARVKNVAIEGLIEDAHQNAEDIQDARMLQAALLGDLQKIEHYCIAAWGTTKAFATAMGEQKVVDAMQRALDEGKQFDQEMTQLAEGEINPMMLEDAEDGEGDEEEGKGKGSGSRRKSAA